MTTREEWCERVKGPGKFEGERPYVPYFWEQYLDGGADEDYGRTMRFDCTSDDVALFPELQIGQSVYLYERDDGFVCETDGPGDDDFEQCSY